MLNANHSLLGRKSLFVVLFEVWRWGETGTFETGLAKPRHIVHLKGALSTRSCCSELNRPSLVDPSLEGVGPLPAFSQVLSTGLEHSC